MRSITLVLSVGLAACAGSQRGSDSCRAAGEHVAMEYRRDANVPDDFKADIAKLVTERCDADDWTTEGKTCMSTAERFDTCGQHFNEVQRNNIERAIKDLEARYRERR